MKEFPNNTSPNSEKGEDKLERSQVKEGVDFVFEQIPELAKIGSKEQYSKYLNAIFPDSKLNNIVYHGTNIDSYNKILKEGFDLNKSGGNLGYMGKIASFFTIRGFTKNFESGAVVSSLVNIKSKYIDNSGNLTEEGLNTVKQKLVDLDIIPFVNSVEELNQGIVLTNNIRFEKARDTIRLINYLFTWIDNPQDTFNSILKELNIEGLKRNDEVVDMLSTDKIHVLGSDQDIENFKKFVENDLDLPV